MLLCLCCCALLCSQNAETEWLYAVCYTTSDSFDMYTLQQLLRSLSIPMLLLCIIDPPATVCPVFIYSDIHVTKTAAQLKRSEDEGKKNDETVDEIVDVEEELETEAPLQKKRNNKKRKKEQAQLSYESLVAEREVFNFAVENSSGSVGVETMDTGVVPAAQSERVTTVPTASNDSASVAASLPDAPAASASDVAVSIGEIAAGVARRPRRQRHAE